MVRYRSLLLMFAALGAPLNAAQACQLVCFATIAQYTGSQVGSVANADAICAAEKTGFKFVRNQSLLMSLIGNGSVILGYSWVGGAATNSLNCQNWTSSSASQYGVAAFGSGSSYYSYPSWNTKTCDNTYPLVCCNM